MLDKRLHLKQRLLQAAFAAISAVLALGYDRFGGTEFSVGSITGPMVDLFDIGILLFGVTLLTVWIYPRFTAIVAALASLLCFPLYFYFTAPGPFRFVFRGEWSTPLLASFRWDFWAMLGMLFLILTPCVSVQAFFAGEGARATRS